MTSSNASDPLVGRLVADRYEVVKKLNQGGVGAVYLAMQRPLDRPVALKVLLQKYADDVTAIRRFEKEAAAIARLDRGPLDGWAPPALPQARARVVLLTPALFAEGAVPQQIRGAQVVAAAVGRPQPISGWDMAARGPKPTRRMAPAGSVYWVDLTGQDPAEWARRVHLKGICSDEQDSRDGFGLAAVGVWP